MLTYEVKFHEIRRRANRRLPFELRWRVGAKSHSKSFLTKTLADGRRSELMAAAKNGERFDEESGLPASELRAQRQCTWFEHATAYSAMKWPPSSAKARMARADALATVTAALVRDRRGEPPPPVLRTALSCWAFNHSDHLTDPPEEVAAALAWLARKSVPLEHLDDADTVREALDALALKLNGKSAAPNTIRRKRMVFNNALRYAVERRLLQANPLQFVDWSPPETDDEIDWRYVPNPAQAAALIAAVAKVNERGRHLAAFFGCIYYAAMRPAEVANLRLRDCSLPESSWGELILAGSSPRVGSRWTDDGRSFEERGLKRRARRSTREVPIPPDMVQLLRAHIEDFGVAADGRLFRASLGGVVLSREYAAVWKAARKLAFAPELAASPLAEVPYSLRHAGVSLWLASGVDPVEVARRAGHSVTVLFRFYAKVLDGKRDQANAQIDRALQEARHPGAATG